MEVVLSCLKAEAEYRAPPTPRTQLDRKQIARTREWNSAGRKKVLDSTLKHSISLSYEIVNNVPFLEILG